MSVLKPLVQELSASSPIAPALLSSASSRSVSTNDSTTETLLRKGTSVDDLWLMAARSGPGTDVVKFTGLPRWAHAGGVYREQRRVIAKRGSFSATFNQWDVHVYHFVEPLKLRAATPAVASVGSRVTLTGRGLAAATAVSFGGVPAHFTISSDRALVATVPRGARRGRIAVTSQIARSESASPFPIRPSVETLPSIAGRIRVGSVIRASRGTWLGDPPTGYSFSWLRCNRHGSDCRPIPGAARSALKLTADRIGKRFRVVVVAHAPSGSGRARSAPTPVVG